MATTAVGSVPSSATASTTTTSSGTSSKIDGLVSGLDTTSIINAIMAQAALPQTNLKNQLTTEQAKLAAYQSINTKMVTLQSASDALTSPSTWQAMAATSSSTSVSATASAGAQAGSFTFDVTRLATSQTSVSANAVSGLSATVVATGTPVTITDTFGDPVSVDVGDGSLGAVVAGINKAKAGVQAAAVQVAPGQYRLQLTSTATGESSGFTTSGLDAGSLGSITTLTTAQDAQLTVGAGSSNPYTISSSSNTFDQAFPGLTFTVSQLASNVTISTSADSSGIASQIQAMVDAANAVLTEIGKDTAFDTTSNTASVLTGDSTARQLQNQILTAVSSAAANGLSSASVGLSVTKTGQITFDANAFQAAFQTDPASVQSMFAAAGSFTPGQSGLAGTVSLQKASDATLAGSYAVHVTQAATKATATVDTSGGINAGDTITIGSFGNTGTYTVQSGDTTQTIVDALNSLAAKNQLSVNASVGDNGLINLSSAGYGSEYTFTVGSTGALTASAVTAGQDVAGTINGQAAQGIGQFLFTNTGTPGVDALSLLVTLTPDDVTALAGADAGTFTYAGGASQQLASVAYGAVSSRTGVLTGDINAENTMISSLNQQISSWQVVLDTKQAALQLQWANLETQLSNLQAQSSQLTSAIAGLPSWSNSQSSSS
jgi:flagellar hook-associated protein 2